MSDLFSSAGLDQNAPRPLADRMRPTKLSEVVGQDHLVGPGRNPDPPHRLEVPRLPDLLGTAGHRQDHGGAADGP